MLISVALSVAFLSTVFILRSIWSWFARRRALHNIRGPLSLSFITGYSQELLDYAALPVQRENNKLYGRVMKISWIFSDPALLVADPLALSHILIKDKENYQEIDYSGSLDVQHYLLGPGLLATIGKQHKRQRKMLNPVFSTGNLRSLSPLIQSLTLQLRDVLLREVSSDSIEVDMAEKVGFLALELVSQAAFSHPFNTLEMGASSSYVRALKELVPALTKMGAFAPLASSLGISLLPGRLSRLLGQLLPYKDLHYLMDLVDILHATAWERFEDRKKAFMSHEKFSATTSRRKDLITILLESNASASESDRLSDEEVCAQIGTLIFAGTDTTSSAMTRILYLLATHAAAQDRLREELNEANWRELNYDSLMELPYLDAVCRETLRLYTPLPNRARLSTNDAILPLQNPIVGADGREIHEIFVPKGVPVFANLDGLNTDPTIWGEDSYE